MSKAFIPPSLRPQVRGSKYLVPKNNADNLVNETLSSLLLDDILMLNKRTKRIVWLIENIKHLSNEESALIRQLKFCILGDKGEK